MARGQEDVRVRRSEWQSGSAVNSRGDEAMGSTWNYLDITALGRQEEWEDSPKGYPQTPPYKWWNWHDEYENKTSSQWSNVVDRSLELLEQEKS